MCQLNHVTRIRQQPPGIVASFDAFVDRATPSPQPLTPRAPGHGVSHDASHAHGRLADLCIFRSTGGCFAGRLAGLGGPPRAANGPVQRSARDLHTHSSPSRPPVERQHTQMPISIKTSSKLHSQYGTSLTRRAGRAPARGPNGNRPRVPETASKCTDPTQCALATRRNYASAFSASLHDAECVEGRLARAPSRSGDSQRGGACCSTTNS